MQVCIENIKLKNKLKKKEQQLKSKVTLRCVYFTATVLINCRKLFVYAHRLCTINTLFALLLQEELAEGLHMIDFEQLKIENQTYNEKIEERNEVIKDYCVKMSFSYFAKLI